MFGVNKPLNAFGTRRSRQRSFVMVDHFVFQKNRETERMRWIIGKEVVLIQNVLRHGWVYFKKETSDRQCTCPIGAVVHNMQFQVIIFSIYLMFGRMVPVELYGVECAGCAIVNIGDCGLIYEACFQVLSCWADGSLNGFGSLIELGSRRT